MRALLRTVRGKPLLHFLAIGLLLLVPSSEGQSNYASHGNSIEFEAPSEENNFGLPQQTVLDGKVTKLDELSSVIFLNRTVGELNCGSGIMQVGLKFDAPFFGIAYANFDRSSACSVHGKGALTYTLELPLKGCGTVQNPQRVFTNNVVVRFHPGLEMDGDEVITVVCRYPPPVAPPPVVLLPRIELPAEASPVEPPLKGFHILLIICAILFLTLLLLGLGCSYYCLRHRKAPVMLLPPLSRPASSLKGTPLFHSSAASTASSQSDATTKLSSGTISMFEGLKIPRAHAGSSPPSALPPAITVASTASDTLPSDYPSESLSSEEEMEVDSGGRMLLVTTADVKGIDRRPSTLSSAGSFDNAGYTREEESYVAAVVPPPAPKFDVSVRVKRAPPSPPPPPSSATSDTTSICSSMVNTRQNERNNLDTIMEESHGARAMPPPMPLLQPSPPPTTFTYVPELHPPPPQHKISERQQQMSQYAYRQKREWTDVESARQIEESDTILHGVDVIPPPANLRASPPPRSLISLNTENTDTRSVSEIIETAPSRPYYAASPPPPPVMPTGTSTVLRTGPPPTTHHLRQEEIIQQTMVSEDLPEPPVVVSRRPEITSHVVDDVFLRTVTERRTVEDIERRRRRAVTGTAEPPPPPPPPPKKWDVVIRNYPDPNPPKNPPPPSSVASSSTLCWESDYTDAAASDYQGPVDDRTPEPREAPIWRDPGPVEEPVVTSAKTPNWDVLIRVLQPPEPTPSERAPSEATTTEYDTAPETDTEDRESERGRGVERIEDDEEELAEVVRRTLTEADKEKWRQIITTESTLRTLLTEATVREDFERIRRDSRYRTLFEPHKWDVIIRVLAPPPMSQSSHSRGPRPPYRRSKSTEWDNRSRRSSLPTLYEYDSDTGASSVSTRRRGDDDEREPRGRAPSSPARSRKGGRAPSSVYSDAPFSVSEVVVADHSRPEAMSDVMSDASGHTSASSSYFAPSVGKRGAVRKALPKGYRRRRFEDSEEEEDEGSLARSMSQPSLARSASEFTERWAVEGRSRETYGEFEDFFEDGTSSPRSGRSRASSGAIGLRRGGTVEGVAPGEDVVGSVRMTTTTMEVEKVRRVVRGSDVWGGYGQE